MPGLERATTIVHSHADKISQLSAGPTKRQERRQRTSGPRLAGTGEPMTGRTGIGKSKPKDVTTEDLTAILAARVMRWDVAPDRFLMDGRRWLPRWRFQPTKSIQDAFRLLEAANPEEYIMRGRGVDEFWVRVRLHSGGVGEASDKSKACAIASAVARAIGVDFT